LPLQRHVEVDGAHVAPVDPITNGVSTIDTALAKFDCKSD